MVLLDPTLLDKSFMVRTASILDPFERANRDSYLTGCRFPSCETMLVSVVVSFLTIRLKADRAGANRAWLRFRTNIILHLKTHHRLFQTESHLWKAAKHILDGLVLGQIEVKRSMLSEYHSRPHHRGCEYPLRGTNTLCKYPEAK
jgi:hypothetical protein